MIDRLQKGFVGCSALVRDLHFRGGRGIQHCMATAAETGGKAKWDIILPRGATPSRLLLGAQSTRFQHWLWDHLFFCTDSALESHGSPLPTVGWCAKSWLRLA